MATYLSGILGAFSGKVGNVVGSSWNGIDYMRSLASHVGNPRTAKQVRNRELFALATQSLSPFTYPIRQGFVTSKGQSAWSMAMKANLRILKTYDEGATIPNFDYSKLVLSNGTAVFSMSITAGRDNDFNVQWTPADLDSPFWGGQVFVVVFNETKKLVETYHADISTGSLTIEIGTLKESETDKMVTYRFATALGVASTTIYQAI